MSENKRYKKESIDSIWDDELSELFSGTIDDVIKRLQNFKKTHNKFSRIELDFRSGHDSVGLEFDGFRLETKEEEKKRIENGKKRKEAAQKRKEGKEAKELAVLKNLLDKHGDKLKDML